MEQPYNALIISGCTSVHPYKFGWEFEFCMGL